MPICYCLTLDTEEAWDWNAGWPVESHDVDYIVDVIPRFEELCASHGASTTYFVNDVVLDDRASRDAILSASKREGSEIGLHIHPWQTAPFEGTLEGIERGSFLASYPREVIRAKLQTTLDSFHRADLRPTSFRGGRYSTSREVQTFLMENGFVADSSVVPYTTWPDDGAPDYRDRSNFPRAVTGVGGRLWEIPVTLGFTRGDFDRWASRLKRLQESWLHHLHLEGVLSSLGIVERLWLNFEDTSPESLIKLVRRAISSGHEFLVFTAHSSSLSLGANPYSHSAEAVKTIWQTMSTMLDWLAGVTELVPATITEMAMQLEGRQ